MRNRTITIAVVEVIEGGTKSEFYADLRNKLRFSQWGARTVVAQRIAQDAASYTVDAKVGKGEKVYTYPKARVQLCVVHLMPAARIVSVSARR